MARSSPARKFDTALVAGALVALAALIVAGPFLFPWLVQLSAPAGAAREVVYSIPAGTADLIEAGGDPKIVPAEMFFTLGVQDVLVIHNEDSVGHTFGPYWVAARNTLRVQFAQPAVYEGYCSVHPSNQIKIIVENRTAS